MKIKYIQAEVSIKAQIREMEAQEIIELMVTLTDPQLIDYCNEQLKQLQGTHS